MLCEALSCLPAWASCASGTGNYAFACVTSDVDLVLTLSNGTSVPITATTQGDVSPFGVPTFGAPSTNYLAGVYNGASYDNFFDFVLPTEGAGVTVTSATLTLYSGAISAGLNYTLFGPTRVITSFTPRSPNAPLYNELGSGTVYATYLLSPNTNSPADQASEIMIALNTSAVSALNEALLGDKQFLVSGSVSPAVPEPSTWVMMIAGFAGLGVVARRHAAKRRAAASAAG
jgi:PEP-CTERM motif-containing protein